MEPLEPWGYRLYPKEEYEEDHQFASDDFEAFAGSWTLPNCAIYSDRYYIKVYPVYYLFDITAIEFSITITNVAPTPIQMLPSGTTEIEGDLPAGPIWYQIFPPYDYSFNISYSPSSNIHVVVEQNGCTTQLEHTAGVFPGYSLRWFINSLRPLRPFTVSIWPAYSLLEIEKNYTITFSYTEVVCQILEIPLETCTKISWPTAPYSASDIAKYESFVAIFKQLLPDPCGPTYIDLLCAACWTSHDYIL